MPISGAEEPFSHTLRYGLSRDAGILIDAVDLMGFAT
jgi:hypothetical protein